MSNTLRLHGLQPARFLCPWDFLGKNTEVGCRFLLQGIFSTQGSNPCLFSSVQLLSHVQLFAIPWTVALQASLSITNSWSLLKLMSIEWVMPSNHLILCHPLLLLPSIFPSIRVFSNESALHIRWPKYWSFSISTSNEYSGLISFGLTGLISLQSEGLSTMFSNTTVQKHQFLGTQLSLGEGNGNPLQYSCLENPMDGGAWWAIVHGVVKSQI